MKRIERMSKDEIVNFLFTRLLSGCDNFCPMLGRCHDSCIESLREYLNEDITVKKVPRIATILTLDGLKEADKVLTDICNSNDCFDCPYSKRNFPDGEKYGNCNIRYLAEEIEIIEEVTE